MIFKVIAMLAAFLTSTGFVPQIIKGIETRQLKDVSLVTLIFSGLGTFLWGVYGVYLNDWIIIIANFFTCTTVVILMIMKYRFRQA